MARNGYSGHTFKLIQQRDSSFIYIKIHLKTNQRVKNLTGEEAGCLAGENPDHTTQDLFEAIKCREHPS